ncbi:MAG: hypothetical protein A2Y80_05725 [Deltaproteobacteria bacterium RBG_13_58_19]|nr:MAG: hypothetical protein A2Y80_05725 [Deltaproteobacteria bacterium RBG_13_58_19]
MEQAKCPGQDTRHWKPGDIFTAECPKCGAEIEFFKDDTRRRCAWCGHLFYNPKIELGCAEWCQYAEKCVPELVKEKKATQTFKELLAERVKSLLGDDPAGHERLDRGLKYATELLKSEGGDPKVVLAAVLLHPLNLSQAGDLLTELETEPEIREAVLTILSGSEQADNLERQIFQDTLTLLREDHPDTSLLTTRTAQRLAAGAK